MRSCIKEQGQAIPELLFMMIILASLVSLLTALDKTFTDQMAVSNINYTWALRGRDTSLFPAEVQSNLKYDLSSPWYPYPVAALQALHIKQQRSYATREIELKNVFVDEPDSISKAALNPQLKTWSTSATSDFTYLASAKTDTLGLLAWLTLRTQYTNRLITLGARTASLLLGL